ncbi:MAG: hydrogenase iron-sulfur subunit [Deltaproteobacteria bacterium]|nr:hydrogenase iron-sulfur subunit [Deltaproteobacteria bacterium]
MGSFVPRIVAFCCDRSGYRAADMAGGLGISVPETIEVVRVPCAGRVDALHILRALESGADGVLIVACHRGNCRSLTGDLAVRARTEHVHEIMERIGLKRERLELCNLSVQDGPKFAETVRRKFEYLKELGPNPTR